MQTLAFTCSFCMKYFRVQMRTKENKRETTQEEESKIKFSFKV